MLNLDIKISRIMTFSYMHFRPKTTFKSASRTRYSYPNFMPALKINGQKIPQVHSTKFSDVVIDDRLLWEDHVAHLENKLKIGLVVRERSHMTSARFWQILPRQHWATPTPQHLPDPLPFQSDISFSKNPLHSTLIETLNVYLIQLKTERCHQFRSVY